MSYELAVSLLEQRKFTESILSFMKHITEEPRHVKSWAGIGIAYFNLNNIFEALKNLEVALKIDPNDPSALISAAVCYSQVDELRLCYHQNFKRILFLNQQIKNCRQIYRSQMLLILCNFGIPSPDLWIKILITRQERIQYRQFKINYFSNGYN